MTDLINYKAFVLVVETGSVKTASQQLNISAPAISKRLFKLEQELQVALFNRTSKQLVLTEAGESFYPECKRILADIANVEADLKSTKNKVCGVITISLSKALLRSSIFNALSDFSNIHPNISFNIQTTDEVIDLVDNQVDFAFRLGELKNSPHIIAHHLTNTRLLAVTSKPYFDKYNPPAYFDKLEHSKLLLMNTFKSSIALKTFFSERSINPENLPAHKFDDIEAVYQGVTQHLGIGLLLDISIQDELEQQTFVQVCQQEKLPTKPLYLVHYKSNFNLQKNVLFKNFIKDYFA